MFFSTVATQHVYEWLIIKDGGNGVRRGSELMSRTEKDDVIFWNSILLIMMMYRLKKLSLLLRLDLMSLLIVPLGCILTHQFH